MTGDGPSSVSDYRNEGQVERVESPEPDRRGNDSIV
jgi:hypothetical protein